MTGTYLYAVVPSASTPAVEGPGLNDRDVRAIRFDVLTGVVSDAPGEILGRRREVLSHAEVVSRLLEAGPVLPVRFGTVLEDDDAVVTHLLEPRREDLTALLEVTRDLVEVRLRAFYDDDAILSEIVGEHPELAETGATVGQRMQTGEQIFAALQERRDRDTHELRRRLEPLARDCVVGPPQTEMSVADLAFLLGRGDLEGFDREVAALGEEVQPRLRLRYVGPVPPASFLDLELQG